MKFLLLIGFLARLVISGALNAADNARVVLCELTAAQGTVNLSEEKVRGHRPASEQ